MKFLGAALNRLEGAMTHLDVTCTARGGAQQGPAAVRSSPGVGRCAAGEEERRLGTVNQQVDPLRPQLELHRHPVEEAVGRTEEAAPDLELEQRGYDDVTKEVEVRGGRLYEDPPGFGRQIPNVEAVIVIPESCVRCPGGRGAGLGVAVSKVPGAPPVPR
jgi:hypothetical protein